MINQYKIYSGEQNAIAYRLQPSQIRTIYHYNIALLSDQYFTTYVQSVQD